MVFNKGVAPRRYAATETVTANLVPPDYRTFTVFDLNRDSRQDIIVTFPDPFAPTSYLEMQLFRGQVDGTFLPYITPMSPPRYGFGQLMGGSVITSFPMMTADYNGDGFPDLFGISTNQALYANFSWTVVKSAGGADFVVQQSDGTTGLRGNTYVSPPVDLNGDGKLDIVVTAVRMAGTIPGWVVVSLGRGDGTFGTQRVVGTDGATAVSVIDANGDGKPDLIVTGGDNGSGPKLPVGPTTFYNDGAANFSTTPPPAP